MQKSLLLKLKLHPSPLWVIFEINFLRHLAVASLTAIFAIYFRQFTNSNAGVGAIFFLGYAAAFLSNLYSSTIIAHLKKRKSLIVALILLTASFALFAFLQHKTIVFATFAVYQFILALFILDIGLYVKHYSNMREIAGNTGKLGSFANIGWLVGPLLGSLIADRFGFEAVFLFSAAVSLIALCAFFFVRLSHEEVHFEHSRTFKENLRIFFKNPNLRKTYFNNAGLGFIYSIWDYLPLLMLGLGATIPTIGLTKTLMGVPQSIFEFPIGRLADRDTGERRLFMLGYVLTAAFTAFLGLTTNLHLFITFFFIAATGTSLLEMTRDSYFFRQIQEKEIELVGVYRTSDTIPYLIGQAFATLTLTLLPIRWWFIIGGSIALIFAFNAYRMKEIPRSDAAAPVL